MQGETKAGGHGGPKVNAYENGQFVNGLPEGTLDEQTRSR